MDGDRDRDPHWNTGLNSLGPNEKQKEGEHEQKVRIRGNRRGMEIETETYIGALD